jgi:hypothetical protein
VFTGETGVLDFGIAANVYPTGVQGDGAVGEEEEKFAYYVTGVEGSGECRFNKR